MTSPSHVCPVEHCILDVPNRFLMCGDHWHMVPIGLQRAVYAAYRRGEGVGTLALMDAQNAAVQAVNERLGYEGTTTDA
jgi:hypothetical protein